MKKEGQTNRHKSEGEGRERERGVERERMEEREKWAYR
jgi:hypothetical protein